MKELNIYVDASGFDKTIGIGIVMIHGEREYKLFYKTGYHAIVDDVSTMLTTNSKSRKNFKYFSRKLDGVIGVAEGYAVLRSLEEIPQGVEYDNINIYTDNMEVFRILNGINRTKNSVMKVIARKCKSIMKHRQVELRWIKAHVDVYGNEIADSLSKMGAKVKGERYREYNKYDWDMRILNYNLFG